MNNNNIEKQSFKPFSRQDEIPRLPIPQISDTFALYRKTLKPLLEPNELILADKDISIFLNSGISDKLQQRLILYEKKQPNSWLERWWFDKAYLEWRAPLLVNSNWWLVLRNSHLTDTFNNLNTLPKNSQMAGFTRIQIRRAAILVMCLLEFKQSLEFGKFPTEFLISKKHGSEENLLIPLCMDQYKRIFGTVRNPLPNRDEIYSEFPCNATHIVVLIRNHVYSIDIDQIIQKSPIIDNKIETINLVKKLERSLTAITQDASVLPRDSRQVGVLTGTTRDNWAKERQQLIKKGSQINLDSLKLIETALFALALDDTDAHSDSRTVLKIPDEDSTVATAFLRRMAHGVGGLGLNRWFDKSITVILTPSGHAGCNGEHSPQDAMTAVKMFEFLLPLEKSLVSLMSNEVKGENINESLYFIKDYRFPFKRLEWVIDDFKAIEAALRDNSKTIEDSEIEVLFFQKFGSENIKLYNKISPDAFVQMSIQLAYYRMHGRLVSTYETASTRKYRHGRTGACRVVSSEMLEFVKAAERFQSNISIKNIEEIARLAAKEHIRYMNLASNGYDLDRHMLGLRLCVEEGEPIPQVFCNEAFKRSSEWRISTSSLGSTAHNALLASGFGSVNPGGYGCNYFLGPKFIRIGIECKRSYAGTSAVMFGKKISKAFEDLFQILSPFGKGNFKVSKL